MSEPTPTSAGDVLPERDDQAAAPEPAPPEAADTAGLQRAVKITAIVLLALLVGFAAYYYIDRYVSPGDASPLEMSVEELEDAIRSDPNNPDTRLALAEVYLAQARYADALGQAGQVLEAYPDNERALLLLGIAHEASGQPEASIAVLETFVDLRKDDEMAHVDTALEAAYFYLGRSYLTVDRSEDAVTALDAALLISPGDADALHQGGLAHQALGHHDVALQYFERATAFVPDFTEVYTAMADSYAALNMPQHQRYAQAMRTYSVKEYQAALPQLTEVTAALPEFAPAYLGLALTHEQLGDLAAAAAAADRALQLDPDYLAAQQTQGRILQQMGEQG